MREKLIALSIVKKGDWVAVHKFLQHDSDLASIDDEQALKLVEQLNCDVVTIVDEDYPAAWREMPKPPFVVFLKGNRELLAGQLVAMIGGKKASDYTSREVIATISTIPADVSVITGDEHGVEKLVNQHAKSKIVCLATGFDQSDCVVGEADLLMSEIPPHASFDIHAYNRSYHMIAELAQVMCIFEMPLFDRRRMYLKYLIEIGKPAFVLPDWKYSATLGGLELVNSGAKLLINGEDVLLALEK